MSYLKLVSVVTVSLLAGMSATRAEDKPAPAKEGDGTRIIILDGKRVRVDDKMNVIERLDDPAPAKAEPAKETKEAVKEEKKEKKAKKQKEAKKEDLKEDKKEAKEEKKEDKKEAAAPAAEPAAPTAEQLAAAAEAKEKAAREIREQAQALVEQDVKMKAAVKKLASPGWRDAQVLLISSGKSAVPYLIDAMGEGADGAQPAAYNLGGHTKADAGRASRQRTLAEVASEVLTELVKNHSDFKGEIPTLDQRAWQTWWTANSATVNFGK